MADRKLTRREHATIKRHAARLSRLAEDLEYHAKHGDTRDVEKIWPQVLDVVVHKMAPTE